MSVSHLLAQVFALNIRRALGVNVAGPCCYAGNKEEKNRAHREEQLEKLHLTSPFDTMSIGKRK